MRALTFNRTSMESKQKEVVDFQPSRATFNRTSMESKLILELLYDTIDELPFNRTSMESKQNQIGLTCPCFATLLIEPVWNRNSEVKLEVASSRTFNRTSMESKRDEFPCCFVDALLLIEPVWNRNLVHRTLH